MNNDLLWYLGLIPIVFVFWLYLRWQYSNTTYKDLIILYVLCGLLLIVRLGTGIESPFSSGTFTIVNSAVWGVIVAVLIVLYLFLKRVL